MQSTARVKLRLSYVCVALIIGAGGCGNSDLFVGPAGLRAFQADEITATEDENNGTFETASYIEIVPDERKSVSGRLSSRSDIDIYTIGEGLAGDRIEIEVVGDSSLDAAAAIFDSDGSLLYTNDDRHFFARQLDPRIDFILPRDVDELFVAVAVSPSSRSRGDYVLTMQITPEAAKVEKHPQSIVLNFDGAFGISFGGRPAVDIPVFDPNDISWIFDGMGDEIIERVTQLVRQDFVGLDVEFITTRENRPFPIDASYIHFGTYDPALLGVAENVDEFNLSPVQDAIIFTETFAVFEVLEPTIEEIAQALANVTSHEAGHLLGLVHTFDPNGVMDITASLRQLSRDQAFSRSPIERSTFPIGDQDAAQTLVDGVGGDLEVVRANAPDSIESQQKIFSETDPDLTARVQFSSCFCYHCEAKRAKQNQSMTQDGELATSMP